MPQSATIEIKTKAGKEELNDKAEFEIGGVASKEETVPVGQKRMIKLFASEAADIDLVIVKSDSYKPELAAGSCGQKFEPIHVTFGDKGPFKLDRALFLSGEAVRQMLPTTVDSVYVDNRLPRDVNISVLVVGKKSDPPSTGNVPANQGSQPAVGSSLTPGH